MYLKNSRVQELKFNYDEVKSVKVDKYMTTVTIDTSIRGWGQMVLHLIMIACALAGHDKEFALKIHHMIVAKDPKYMIVEK